MTVTLYRGKVRDNWFVTIAEKHYQVLRSMPGMVPPEPYDGLLNWLNHEVIIEGLIVEDKIHATNMMLMSDYNPGAPPTLHRQGSTLHPKDRTRPLVWRSLWSMTHAIEPAPQENPPWNATIQRSPQAIQRINDFLDVERTARYEARGDWTCCTVFVSDFTRMMHCEICLDPAGNKKWYNRSANWMIRYLRQVGIPQQGWRLVTSARQAQDLANQGYPVVAFIERPSTAGHVAMVIPGNQDAQGFPLLAQAGENNSKAWRWIDPAVQYLTHD